MLEEWKTKLIEETEEEANKLNKLNEFMSSETFYKLSRIEKDLLYEQVRTLNTLVQILGKRCEFYKLKLNMKEVK